MKQLLTVLIVLFIGACTAPVNQETVNFEDETILIGEVNWDGLTQPPYDVWFREYYVGYGVDAATLDQVKEKLVDVEIVLFLGSWCEDSQIQVPQFYKMLDYVGYDVSKMTVYALEKLEDGKMVSPGKLEEKYGIEFVPTYIFLKDGSELGRITEFPMETVERDMLGILSSN